MGHVIEASHKEIALRVRVRLIPGFFRRGRHVRCPWLSCVTFVVLAIAGQENYNSRELTAHT